jgi:hypothetical protein
MSSMFASSALAQTGSASAESRGQASPESVATLWSGQNDTIDVRLPDTSPYTSFERYAHPEECARAVAWNEEMVWATRRRDSVALGRYGNPSNPSAVAAGERCLAQFPEPWITTHDWLGLGAAYLAVNNDSAAATAFTRAEHDAASRSPEPSLERRAWIKTYIVELYLDAPQPRISAAAGIQKQLDALDARAAIPQMMAHIRMAQAGMRADSVALWENEARAAIAAFRRATPELRHEYAVDASGGYWLLMRAQLRKNDVPGARATVERMRNDLLPVQQYLQGRVAGTLAWIGNQGTPAPSIRATQWVNVSAPNDTIHPAPGRVSIVLFSPANCGYRCANQYAMIRRLADRFGSSLDIVIMTRTQGFYGRRLVAPDSEISLIRHYFVDQLRLPARIAVWKTETHRREDDAVEPNELPNETAYPLPRSDDPVAAMIAPDGKWRMFLDFTPSYEVLIADVIREELARIPK